MLHQEAVEPGTLELIRELQADSELQGFTLVGGTALSLMIGHRRSVDIDLFSITGFDHNSKLEYLEKRYGFSLQYMQKNTLKGIINNVFVDLITHAYPAIRERVTIDGVTMMSKEDIAAMKVNVITGNGTRPKDFIDLYFLLKEFSLDSILGFYAEKYAQRNTFHALKSLTWFDEMNETAWPEMLLEKNLTPEKLKKELISKSTSYF